MLDASSVAWPITAIRRLTRSNGLVATCAARCRDVSNGEAVFQRCVLSAQTSDLISISRCSQISAHYRELKYLVDLGMLELKLDGMDGIDSLHLLQRCVRCTQRQAAVR